MSRSTSRSRGSNPSAEVRLAATTGHSIISLTSKGGAVPRRVDPNTLPKEAIVNHVYEVLRKDEAGLPPDYEEVRRLQFLEKLRPMTIFDDSKPNVVARKNPPRSSLNIPEHGFRGRRSSPSLSSTPNKEGSTLSLQGTDWIRTQLDAVPMAIPGTCLWIYEQFEFIQWRSSSSDTLLLIGDLATGKSVLAKSICERLIDDKELVIPFFCQEGTPKHSSALNIFATWIYHLLSKFKRLGRYITNEHLENVPQFSFWDLWTLFCDLVDDEEMGKCFLVIDALDQCDRTSQLDLKNALSESRLPLQAKLIMTSKPLNFWTGFGNLMPRIDMDAELLSHDIEIVLSYEVERRGLSDIFAPELIEFVCKEIRAIVQGMFLFIGAKLEELDAIRGGADFQTSPEFLHNFFTQPPKFLEERYESELRPRVISDSSHLREVALVLSILLVANQDSISEEELKTACSFSIEFPSDSQVLESSRTSLDLLENVRRICGPLVRYTTSERRLSLAHPVVRTFLTKKRGNSSSDPLDKFLRHIDLETGHSALAQACLKHLISNNTTRVEMRSFSKDSFLAYSLKNWPVHVRESHDKFRGYVELLSKFLTVQSEGYENWSDFARLSRNEFGTTPNWWQRPIPIAVAIVNERLTNVMETAVKLDRPGFVSFAGKFTVDIDELDEFGRTALLVALQNSDLFAARKLLDMGASVEIPDRRLPSPLHLAVSMGNEQLTIDIAKQGADAVDWEAPLKPRSPSQSALFLGVSATVTIFKLLLDLKPRLFVRSIDGWSILHEAAQHADSEKLAHILSLEILDINCKAYDGTTPLMVAAGVDHETTALLLESGANPDAESNNGTTAIYEAASRGILKSVALLHQKGTVSERGKFGETPLMGAISQGHNEVVRYFISRRIGINTKTLTEDTALMFAVRYKHGNFVQQLLRAHVDPDVSNKKGETALLIASSGTRPEIVQSLLRYSKDPNEASKSSLDTWSCLHAAAFSGQLEIVKRLVNARESSSDVDELFRDRRWTPFMAALRGRHDDVARYLLDCGANTEVKSDTGWTALHMACFYSLDEKLVIEVLKKSPVSYLSEVTDKGSTPLSLAAEEGHTRTVRILARRRGVQTLIRNELGNTPLYYAADFGSNGTVKLLMAFDYEADIRGHFGWTALHAACKRCDREVIEKLVKVTNWTYRYRLGLTPIHIAIDNGNDDAFFALLEAGLPANLPSGWGSSPLLHAAASGNTLYVDHLLKQDADVNCFNWVNYLPINGAYKCKDIVMTEKLRPSPSLSFRLSRNTLDSIMNGAACVSLEEVKWAVERGTRVSTRNANHETPLSLASENGLVDVVNYFMELDPDDYWLQIEAEILLTGWTPLHIAARFRQADCIAVLCQHGYLDSYAEDCFGYTAFDYASGDVPSWLALTDSHEASHIVRSKYAGHEDEIDIQRLWEIVSWRLERLRDPDNQFDEADAHLVSFVLVDPFLRLGDLENAVTAIEIYLGEPSFRLNAGINCQLCGKTRNTRISVCKTCHFRLVCNDCKQMTQRTKLKGCFQHDFINAPSESWFKRDVRCVNEELQTEEEWLESVKNTYRSRNPEKIIELKVTGLNTGPVCTASEIFGRYKPSSLTRLVDHVREHPRDIGVRDERGRNIVMHVLETALADDICCKHLQSLANEGAKMLVVDAEGNSTVKIACEKKLGKSLTFIMDQWDYDFDRREDHFSSKAVEIMIRNQWISALSLAIEKHFDWVARDKYHYIRQLSGMKMSDKAIIDKLLTDACEEQSDTSVTSSEGIWAYFEPPPVHTEPQIKGHISGCVHSTIANQISALLETPRTIGSVHPGFYIDDDTYAGQGNTVDHKLGARSYWQSNEQAFSILSADRPATPSEFSDPSDRGHDFDRTLAIIDIVQDATALCGLGGLFPDSETPVQFTETSSWISEGQPGNEGIIQNPEEDIISNTRDVIISYRAPKNDSTTDFTKLIEMLKRAGKGLTQAFARAQDAQLCCSSFSILVKTLKTTKDGHPIIKLESIPLSLVHRFLSGVDRLPDVLESSNGNEDFSSCTDSARKLLDIILPNKQNDDHSFELQLHHCALTMQALSLGFVSFLLGHRASAPIPILTCGVSMFHLTGIEQSLTLKLMPVEMACVGDMLEDELFVFSSALESQVSFPGNETNAYLLAKVEDVLEIWGPFICLVGRSADGLTTGQVLAIEIGGGQLNLTGMDENGTKLAHWNAGWNDTENLEGFSTSQTVLIGVLKPNGRCGFDVENEWLKASEGMLLTPLQTRGEVWRIIERSTFASVSAPHVNLGASQTWGPDLGLPMKKIVVKHWERGFGYLNVLNKPFGVVVSLCTGFAERVPLRIAIAQVLHAYVESFTPPQSVELSDDEIEKTNHELYAMLTGLGCQYTWEGNNQFFEYIQQVRRLRRWKYIRVIILFILAHLEETGYKKDRKVFRVAWADPRDPTGCFELTCARRNDYRWLRLMEDNLRSATFAVATGVCLVAHSYPQAPYGYETCLRRQIVRQQDPKAYGLHLLHTTIVPRDASASDRRTWPLNHGIWYKIGSPGDMVKSRLSILQPHDAKRPIPFLLVIEPHDHLENPTDSVKHAFDRREHVFEDCQEARSGSSLEPIHIIRWADWEQRKDIGDEIF